MATRITTPGEGWNQNLNRNPAIFYDQHKDTTFTRGERDDAGNLIYPFANGRPWWCYVERPADGASMPMPVGPLNPMGWEAPWIPEDKYIVESVGRVTSSGGFITRQGLQEQRFRIDYEKMRIDYKAQMDVYYEKAVQEASDKNMPLPDYGSVIPYKLRVIIGRPPKSPKIPEAALAGDRWLLGFSKEENETLARLLFTGDENIPTIGQNESAQDRMAEMEEQLAQFRELLAAMKAGNAETEDDEDAEKRQAAKDRMAHARAARKSKTPAVPSGT